MQPKEDDWTAEFWDDLIKDRSEHWDLHDAFKHGKSKGRGDPSEDNVQFQRGERPTKARNIAQAYEGEPPDGGRKVFIDARTWEGIDLNHAVDSGDLTVEQAFSIMRLRSAIGRGPSIASGKGPAPALLQAPAQHEVADISSDDDLKAPRK